MPLPCSHGFIAAGLAAGCVNPLLPTDMSPAVGSMRIAFTTSANTPAKGLPNAQTLWEFPRSLASTLGQGQAWACAMATALDSLDNERFNQLFSSGLLDAYAALCIIREKSLVEDFLDTIARYSGALFNPSLMLPRRLML